MVDIAEGNRPLTVNPFQPVTSELSLRHTAAARTGQKPGEKAHLCIIGIKEIHHAISKQ